MRELALVFFLLAAAATPAPAEENCRNTGQERGEIAICGDTGELDAAKLASEASLAGRNAPPAAPRPPASDALASGARPIGPADRENVPKGRQY